MVNRLIRLEIVISPKTYFAVTKSGLQIIRFMNPTLTRTTKRITHWSDVTMSAMASKITGVSIVCSVVCLGADQRKHQSSAPMAFVRGIQRWQMDSPHKWPVAENVSIWLRHHKFTTLVTATEAVATQDIRPKLIVNSNLAYSRYSKSFFSVDISFWKFAQSTAVILPGSVQICKTI